MSKECSKQNIRKVRRRRLNFVSLGRVGSHSHALLRKYPPLCVQWKGHAILRGTMAVSQSLTCYHCGAQSWQLKVGD